MTMRVNVAGAQEIATQREDLRDRLPVDVAAERLSRLFAASVELTRGWHAPWGIAISTRSSRPI